MRAQMAGPRAPGSELSLFPRAIPPLQGPDFVVNAASHLAVAIEASAVSELELRAASVSYSPRIGMSSGLWASQGVWAMRSIARRRDDAAQGSTVTTNGRRSFS